MEQFRQIFKKVDGIEIIRQYLKSHVILLAFFEIILLGFSKKSLEIVRLATTQKKMIKIRRKYRNVVEDFKKERKTRMYEESLIDRKIWVCWFQGLENAPPIVKRCVTSLKDNICKREIVIITKENYSKYVKIPDYIIYKHKKGIIGRTHFSDILRLELLIKYGGTWIDSTVLATTKNIPQFMLDDDLFIFRTLKPGLDGHAIRISNWFITSKPHNEILELTLHLLYLYWEKNNSLIDYYIFHMFFELAIEAYPEQWKKVVPMSNEISHVLLLRLFEEYDAKIFDNIVNQVCFHKLTYKISNENINKKNTYYHYLMKIYKYKECKYA